MKKCVFILLLLLFIQSPIDAQLRITSITATSIQNESTLLTGLQAYWKLDESSGLLYDQTTNNVDLTAGSTPTYSATGKINTAIQIDSDLDVLYNSDETLIQPSGGVWSFSTWIYFNTLQSTLGWNSPICRLSHATSPYWCILIEVTSSDRVNLRMYNTSDAHYQVTTGTSMFSTSTWYHIVCVFNGNGNPAEIWINGTEQTSSPGNQVGTFKIVNNGWYLSNSYNGGNDGGRWIQDETACWDKALSEAEIAELFNTGSGNTYPF